MGKKALSRAKILDAAGRLFRAQGVAAVPITDVMAACAMTHGGFYAHFKSKAGLAVATLAHVAAKQRETWFSGLADLPPATILSSLTARYLNRAHRDQPESGCPYVALAFDAAQGETPFKEKFAAEIERTVTRLIESGAVADRPDALAYLSLCVGGLLLSRASGKAELADAVIRAARAGSLRVLAQRRKNQQYWRAI